MTKKCLILSSIVNISIFLCYAVIISHSFQPHYQKGLLTKPLAYHQPKKLVSLSSTTGKYGDEVGDVSKEIEINGFLSKIYECLGAGPIGKLQIKQNPDGVRGIYLNSSVEAGDILLQVPLSSCLRDDQPPSWLDNHENMAWSTRLAACLLDIEHTINYEEDTNDFRNGHKIWWEQMLMPQKELLKRTLPIHWEQSVLEYAKCRSLELAVDAAYFSRAEALSDLNSFASIVSNDDDENEKKNSPISWTDKCQTALDFVQTRCCGVNLSLPDGDKHIRLVSPIFDLLNHASGEGQNAEFMLEKQKNGDSDENCDFLVVRSLHKINSNDEVTISYGDDNLTPWKCLSSYGFVPPFNESYSTAEISINGVWGEVSAGTVPIQLIEACSSQQPSETTETNIDETKSELTSDIAMYLADIGKKTALMLEDDQDENAFSEKHELEIIQAHRLKMSQYLLLMQWSQSLASYAESFVS